MRSGCWRVLLAVDGSDDSHLLNLCLARSLYFDSLAYFCAHCPFPMNDTSRLLLRNDDEKHECTRYRFNIVLNFICVAGSR